MDGRKKVVIAIGGVALSLGLAFLIFGGVGGSYGSSPSTTVTGRQGAPSVQWRRPSSARFSSTATAALST